MSYWRPTGMEHLTGGAVNSIRYRLTDLFPENGDQSGRRHFPAIFSPTGHQLPPPRGWPSLPRQAMFLNALPEETPPGGEINRDIQPRTGDAV